MTPGGRGRKPSLQAGGLPGAALAGRRPVGAGAAACWEAVAALRPHRLPRLWRRVLRWHADPWPWLAIRDRPRFQQKD